MSNQKDFSAFSIESSKGIFFQIHLNFLRSFKQEKTCVFTMNSSLKIEESSFLNYETNALFFAKSRIFIKNCEFFLAKNFLEKEKIGIFGAIFSENCEVFLLFFSRIFSNSNEFNGGACILTSNSNENRAFLLNNTFANNFAKENGGALFIFNGKTSLKNSNFIENSANKGGGLCYFSSQTRENSIMILQGNSFVKNEAFDEGGAIKWETLKIVEFANSFVQNSAIYGENIAAFPMKIRMKVIAKSEKESCEGEESSDDRNITNFYCVSSGNDIGYGVSVEVLDDYENIVNNLQGK